MSRILALFIVVYVVLLQSGCRDPIGTPCIIEGTGFTASHNCRGKCLYYNAVICPDGRAVVPKFCSGATQCEPGSCPDGQVCYNYDDPFDEKNYCIPDDLCGPMSSENRSAWEREALLRAQSTRAKWARKRPMATKPVQAEEPL
ncbi:MAG: hypothetical protein R3E64_18140 [Halioglobus sp.]